MSVDHLLLEDGTSLLLEDGVFLLAESSGVAILVAAMGFEVELAAWLASVLSVEAYPLTIPEGTLDYPVLVFTLVDSDDDLVLSGPSGLAMYSIQVDAYSPLFAEAAGLAERLRDAVRALRGPIGSHPVVGAILRRSAAGFEPPGTGQDSRGMYRRMSEYEFWIARPSP